MMPRQSSTPIMAKRKQLMTTSIMTSATPGIAFSTVVRMMRMPGICERECTGRSRRSVRRTAMLPPKFGTSAIQPPITTTRSSQFQRSDRYERGP